MSSNKRRRRTSVKLKVEQNPNPRAHKALLKFKSKTVSNSKIFTRKPKHSKGIDQHE